ncbi:MAG: regulatory protein GemA [Methylococcales bacterium]|nr:regulatory protein GemA [Methylococcales bacterium]
MSKKGNRSKELARIHVLKKQVGLTDEGSYRDMLEAQTGKRSAGDMTLSERHKVIKHLQKSVKPTKDPYGKPPKNFETSPQWQKVGALLAEQEKPWGYARAIVKQMFKKEDLEFSTNKELTAVITALVKRSAWIS